MRFIDIVSEYLSSLIELLFLQQSNSHLRPFLRLVEILQRISHALFSPIIANMGDYSAQLDFSKGGSEQNGKAAKQGRPWHSGIPMRIDLYERLEIRASKIPGAGRGMFALDAIGSSEVIFEIPTPIFCIVGRTPWPRNHIIFVGQFVLGLCSSLRTHCHLRI